MELACITEPCSSHLEDVFVRNLAPDPSAMSKDYQDAAELNIGLLSFWFYNLEGFLFCLGNL